MANVRIQLDLTVPSSAARWLLTAALLAGCAPELASESVTLSTYYPAPSGVYSQMIATNNNWMARDTGTTDIGLNQPATNTVLTVHGNASFNSNVSVTGSETVTGNMTISGWENIGGSDTVGGNLQVNGSANINGSETVGGNASIAGWETIGGISTVNGKYIHLAGNGPGCAGQWANGDVWNTLCPGGNYATFTTGLYVEGWSYQSRGTSTNNVNGDSYLPNDALILCCPK